MSAHFKSILLAGAFGTALAALPAAAQDYRDDGRPIVQTSEEVEVIAPREYRHERSDIGAPIRNVAMSRAVRYDDLDLATDWGAERLRERVRYTAGSMCRELDRIAPITVSDGPSCYHAAVDDALDQAEAAIDRARGE